MLTHRRRGLQAIGLALVAIGASRESSATPAAPLAPAGAKTLNELTAKLASLPRRRDFKTVPMILNSRDQWDAEALDAVLHYAGGPKQGWDNTDISGPWLNVMRNSLNAQVWSFGHPDFLCVYATHGSAQFAIYDDPKREK